MDLIRAAVLGIVQGLTEFLPISSSGHLRIVPELLGWEDPGAAFGGDQLGTMAAVLLYFREDLWRITTTWVRRCGPHAAVRARRPDGLVPHHRDRADRHLRRGLRRPDRDRRPDLRLIGTMLIVFGLVLYVADRTGREERDLESLDTTDGVSVGLASWR